MLLIPIGDENPRKRLPLVTWGILLANVGVFVHAAMMSEQAATGFYERYAFFPSHPIWYAYLSSAFLHGGLAHLFFNMLFLWIFADNVEDVFGHVGFLIFYVLAAVAAVEGFVVMHGGVSAPMVGASGAIAGVLGAYLVLFPTNRIRVFWWFFFFFRVFYVSAFVAIIFWFLMQMAWIYVELNSKGSTGVAYSAHAAGFLFGFVVAAVLRTVGVIRPRRPSRPYSYG
ncbi:MAG: rhomboid family intramembrane serine protease [Planctomycetota bacterium]